MSSTSDRRTSSPLTPDRWQGFDCGLKVEWSWRIELAAGQLLGATPCSLIHFRAICEAVADPSDNREYERPRRRRPASDNRSRTGTAWKATDGSRTPVDESPRKARGNRCRKTVSPETSHRPRSPDGRKSLCRPPDQRRRTRESGFSRPSSKEALGFVPVHLLLFASCDTGLGLTKCSLVPPGGIQLLLNMVEIGPKGLHQPELLRSG